MRLTKQTNIAMRILMYCAANDGRLSQVHEIADAYGLSRIFLFKVLRPLVGAGIISSRRGRNGGIKLAKSADEISLLDVVRLTEENFAMAECFEEGFVSCPLVEHCGLSSAWHSALEAFFHVLLKHSLADIVRAQPHLRLLLGLPAIQ